MHDLRTIRLMLVYGDGADLGDLRHALAAERPPMELVGRASTCAQAAELAAKAKPDVILLDAGPGETDHAGTILKLSATSGARVLMLAGERDAAASVRAVRAGARGVLVWQDAPALVGKAVRKVLAGELWLDRTATARIVDELLAAKARTAEGAGALDKLTARELDVVRALLEHDGAASRDLAARLRVSEHTLRNHFTSIYRKLGVPNRVGLFAYVSRHWVDSAS